MYEFPKSNRILRRLEYKDLLRDGVKVVDPNLVLLGSKSSSGTSRMGLIVSKKVGIAVVRNRVKRKLRERFRVLKNDIERLDFIVIARHRAKGASTKELINSLDRCLYRLGKKVCAEKKDCLRK